MRADSDMVSNILVDRQWKIPITKVTTTSDQRYNDVTMTSLDVTTETKNENGRDGDEIGEQGSPGEVSSQSNQK